MSVRALDGPLRAVAKSLSEVFGMEGTIEYVTTGGYNTSTGLASYSENDQVTVRGVVEEYSEREIDGTTVKRGDVKWTVPAKDIERPRKNDLATLDGVRYTIQNSGRVQSGQQSALYVLQLRA